MNADIKGALSNIDRSYRVFEHNGKPMTKEEVRKVLVYGIKKGYDHTGELTPEDINNALTDNKS